MSERDVIHSYLKSLSKFLSRLDKAEAEEVIKEIECHIYDVLESQPGQWEPEEILVGFGSPRELAAQYVDHMIDGTPPPKGFKAIQTVKKGATKGLYYTTALFGYSISLGSIGLGLLKPFMPENVGVWSDGSGNSVVIGLIESTPVGTQEILGWWYFPFAIAFGLGGLYLTRRVLGILKDKL